MKALSIKQPWASLIAHGIKDIENRTWKTKFRGKIFIHACGKPLNRSTVYDVLNEKQWDFTFDEINPDKFDSDNLYYSAIIGEVEIVDCVINHPSIWAEKTDFSQEDPASIWNWVLANPVLYEKPILNVKGKLSFWFPDTDIVECIGCSQKFDSEFMEEDDANEKYCQECWEELSPIMAQEYDELKAKDEID